MTEDTTNDDENRLATIKSTVRTLASSARTHAGSAGAFVATSLVTYLTLIYRSIRFTGECLLYVAGYVIGYAAAYALLLPITVAASATANAVHSTDGARSATEVISRIVTPVLGIIAIGAAANRIREYLDTGDNSSITTGRSADEMPTIDDTEIVDAEANENGQTAGD
jgi:hypothetical protein